MAAGEVASGGGVRAAWRKVKGAKQNWFGGGGALGAMCGASRWPGKAVPTVGRSPEKRTRGGELRRGVASLCEASRGGEWDQERLGEAGWHSSWWRRAKPQ